MNKTVNVIGAGLAGSEAAWQLSRRGFKVRLYEQRPVSSTGAHHTDQFAELVCSNSLRSNATTNAVGLLKQEMRLLDSLIIGIICYIVCSILQMPYTLLVSVIVGVTNIIPFFGPLIGAVPSALIILMVNPTKCLIFVIFVIILQQIDGNIIGPRILGNSTGITGFWVIFSIILGGGLFKFWGLLLGVPVFVVLYSLVTNLIVKKLKRSDLPWELKDYEELEYIDPATLQVVKKASVRKEEIARERAGKGQERPQE